MKTTTTHPDLATKLHEEIRPDCRGRSVALTHWSPGHRVAGSGLRYDAGGWAVTHTHNNQVHGQSGLTESAARILFARKTADHFHSGTGDLCRYSTTEVIRPGLAYSWHHRTIRSGRDLRACLRAGEHAWPGGYATYFVTSDGGVLSHQAVREELGSVLYSIRDKIDDGWRVVALQCTADDDHTPVCEHTNKDIV